MADLGPIEEDVPFDNATADTFSSACESAASLIEGQVASRNGWKNTALTDFQGRFAQIFRNNASVAAADSTEVATQLRKVAEHVRYLKEEARKEQRRREVAREWKREQENKSLWDKGVDIGKDVLGIEDEVPVGPPSEPNTIPVSPPVNGTRETPPPGQGGGSGGTSSARPSDLRAFATGSRGANQNLHGRPATLKGHYADFRARCRWGRIDCDGVFAGFSKYNQANEEDVRWAEAVADAFAAAGGEGNVSTVSDSALLATLQAHNVDVTRQDIVVDPPQAYGNPPTSGYADDPVNAATGNFIENEADLGFAGGCAGLALVRTYNSFNTGAGAFGAGWSSWTEAGLELGDESARMTLPDGRVVVFPRLGAGWDRAVGESMWVERAETGHRVRNNNGSQWLFGTDGRLREFSRGTGTAIRLRHDDQRLVRLEHERGRAVDLAWEGGRIVAAHASDGRSVSYAYDGDRLVSVTGPLGTRSYGWNDDDLIVSVTDADGVVEVENAYDDQRRVAQQRSPFGRVSRFTYLPGNITEVADESGTRANTWISDNRGRQVGIVDTAGNRQSTSYDEHDGVVLISERDGAATVHEYDGRGRRTRTVTPTGADVQWAYDDLDRVTTVVTEQGAVTGYEYAGAERNPAVMVDPEGGRTELEWTDGLLTRVTDPTGVVVRFGYDAHGDLVSTTDAAGNVARMERDALGRVVAAITPSGHRTTYAYAASGLLASRRDPDGATWRYEHTTAGRLAAVVDPLGGRTAVEYGSHGQEVRTVDPLGRAISHQLDDLGNLASTELPDGSTWRFSHDALSRLTSTTTPDGSTWQREYNEIGVLVSTEDPTGVRHTFAAERASGTVSVQDPAASVARRFDPLGRVTAAEEPDGSAVLVTYDRCGRPVELLDAEGGLTRVDRDAAGRAVAITSPGGAVTRLEYDDCGRLAARTDATGARTTLEYDADGRVVRRKLPTGEVARTEFDPLGRVVAHHQPGRGTARYAYDAAGRMVRASDTWFGRRRFRYDAAGQLEAVVNGNGGVTRYEYDVNGRAYAVIDPQGGVTRRSFDPMNRCVAETDPLGRSTRAGYDSAGRQVWQEDPEGRRTSWTYDAAGRVASVSVDGATISSISRDLDNRKVTITDHTGPEHPITHEFAWNRRQQLVQRLRDGRGVSWQYDADGRRTSMTGPDGSRTTYRHDAAGRLVAVEHPLLGRATFERDASGRLVAATAGDVIQAWEHQDAWVVAHSIGDASGFSRTSITRDAEGRIESVEHDGVTTSYGYDEACQLIEAHVGGSQTRWRYDAAGRLVEESVDGSTRSFAYDVAGQLTEIAEAGGRRISYGYDQLGRRTRVSADGRTRELRWGPTGWLAGITDRDGDEVRQTRLHVDATGELAAVDGSEVFWDSATGYAPSLVQAGDTPVLPAGPVTGIGSSWFAPGWRSARAASDDPWSIDPAARLAGVMGVGAGGELTVGDLEWLGARVYDPGTRGFLSVDPLEPVLGAGWSGNPYSYAGNDPLHAVDPTGLKPVTEADLAAINEAARNDWFDNTTDWVGENWEYLAGGAMVIAGGALMITGVGGPLGLALVSAGADTLIQKATTGEVNWGQVAVSGAIGGLTAGAGTLLGTAAKGGTAAIKTSIAVNAGIGGVSSTGAYVTNTLLNGEQITPQGVFSSLAGGTLSGTFGGMAGPLGGTIATKLGASSTGLLSTGSTALLNFTGGAGGYSATQYLNGQPINPTMLFIAGGANAGGGYAADHFFPSTGTSTLNSQSYFGPRTLQGAFNFQGPNTAAMWSSATGGSLVGFTSDVGAGQSGVGQ